MKKIMYTLCLALFVSGCGVLKPATYEKGYYPAHFTSCGPQALEKAIQYIKHRDGIADQRYLSSTDISKKIQDRDNKWRHLGTLFHKDGARMTCPHEVEKVLKEYGYSVTTIKNFTDLDPDKHVALVLIYSNMATWHWMAFPIDYNIDKHYGEGTKVVKIFIITKINR